MLLTKIPVHKGDNFFGISVGFLRNPALFTAEVGIKTGDFYKVSLPGYSLYVVTDPKIIHHMMIANASSYAKGKMYWKQLRAVIGKGMGSLDGDEWLFLRKLQNPFFTKTKIKTYLSDVVKITRKHLNKWKVGKGKELEIVSLISQMNTEIILNTVFGLDNEADFEKIAAKISDGQETISWRSQFPWRPFQGWLNGRNQRAKKHLVFFDALTQKGISSKSNGNFDAKKNLLNRLLKTPSLSQKDIRNEIIVHLGASTETAAVGKAWTLYLLAKHPEVLARVRNEIEEKFNGRELVGDSAFELIYTEQVIKESLRLYPPSYANTRDCVKDDEINGIKIKKGSSVFISLYALHRHPKYWNKPNEFIPERFAPENAAKIHANTYLPYGVGKHHCIGRYLATPMLVLAIAEICRRFDFELVDKKEKPPLSLSTLKPEGGMLMRFFERK